LLGGAVQQEFNYASRVTRPRGGDRNAGIHYLRGGELLDTPPRVPKRPSSTNPSTDFQPVDGPPQPGPSGDSSRLVDAGASAGTSRSKFGKSAKMRRGADLLGMAKISAMYKKLPKLSSMEKRIEGLGIAVPRWSMYRSLSRIKCVPASNRCHWFGIPDKLDHGWHYADQLVSPGTKVMLTPGNCDMYDVFVHQLARHVNLTNPYYEAGVNMGNQWSHLLGVLQQIEGGPDSYAAIQTHASTSTQVPDAVLSYTRGLNFRQYVTTKIENISNLEAFIDTYELIYDPALRLDINNLGFTTGINTSNPEWFGGGSTLRAAATDPQYGHDLSAALMIAYANECLVARGKQLGLDATGSLQALEYTQSGVRDLYDTDANKALAKMNMIERLFCSTVNDPLEAWPRGVKNLSGFRLRKVGKRQCLLPAQCISVSHFVKGRWNYYQSPRGISREGGQTDPANTVVRTVGKTSVRFYRFHGDMIQSNVNTDVAATDMVDVGNSYKNTDFQTGSCALLFQTERTLQTRLHSCVNATIVPFVVPFDAKVELANQFHIDHDGNFDKVATEIV